MPNEKRESVAIVFDTSVMVLLSRHRPAAEATPLIRAALHAIELGYAAIPAVTRTELLVRSRPQERVQSRLEHVPVVLAESEVADSAGLMGAFLRDIGRPIQVSDLLIAATALWLDVRLLHWDSDFARSRDLAESTRSEHPGAELWRRLRLHPASLAA